MAPDIRDFVRPHIRAMTGYVPGLQLNDRQILKLNTNENPFPLPEAALADIQYELLRNRLHLYPSPDSAVLRERIGELYGCGAESVFIGNGSDEILRLIFQLFLGPDEGVVVLDPSYSLYPVLAGMFQARLECIPLKEDWTADLESMLLSRAKLAVITNPNAPTGIEVRRKDLLDFVDRWNRPVLIDEAYTAFGTESVMREAGRRSHLMVCSTFSKSFSLAGMRIGWLIAHPDLIREIDKLRDSYNLSFLSQAAALAALKHLPVLLEHAAEVCRVRDDFMQSLSSIGFEVLPSKANFVFAAPPSGNGRAVYDYLFDHNILVRYFSQERIRRFVRISIGTEESMRRVAGILAEGVNHSRF
jgi:histidinol-phosphate aminotransferase